MAASGITPADLAAWRHQIAEKGDGDHVDPTLAQQIAPRLVAEVEQLRAELARARIDFACKAAASLEKRLQDVGTFNHGGRASCRDAEARAFLARLKRIAESGGAGQ